MEKDRKEEGRGRKRVSRLWKLSGSLCADDMTFWKKNCQQLFATAALKVDGSQYCPEILL